MHMHDSVDRMPAACACMHAPAPVLQVYANAKGIKIVGDMPIYVGGQSADVWANQHLFELNEETGAPDNVSGVPPDAFSATGQLWGSPLYRWARPQGLCVVLCSARLQPCSLSCVASAASGGRGSGSRAGPALPACACALPCRPSLHAPAPAAAPAAPPPAPARWPAHAAEGYKWWGHRMGRALQLYDETRIDHFRRVC